MCLWCTRVIRLTWYMIPRGVQWWIEQIKSGVSSNLLQPKCFKPDLEIYVCLSVSVSVCTVWERLKETEIWRKWLHHDEYLPGEMACAPDKHPSPEWCSRRCILANIDWSIDSRSLSLHSIHHEQMTWFVIHVKGESNTLSVHVTVVALGINPPVNNRYKAFLIEGLMALMNLSSNMYDVLCVLLTKATFSLCVTNDDIVKCHVMSWHLKKEMSASRPQLWTLASLFIDVSVKLFISVTALKKNY